MKQELGDYSLVTRRSLAPALLSAALAQWITKIVYETVATPLTYAVVGYMKRTEEMDVTDVPRSLNPLGIFA